jgi:ketosteroid isomerase-like protein
MKIACIAFILVYLAACSTKSKAPCSVDNSAFVKNYFALFNQHNWKDLSTLYAPTATFKDPKFGNGAITMTREKFAAEYTELEKNIPNVKDSVIAYYQSTNNEVIVEFISTGTGPDGKPFSLPICVIFTLENGLITKDYTYYDNF